MFFIVLPTIDFILKHNMDNLFSFFLDLHLKGELKFLENRIYVNLSGLQTYAKKYL